MPPLSWRAGDAVQSNIKGEAWLVAMKAMARSYLHGVLLLALVGMFAPPAGAGTSDAPEITDPAGDQDLLVIPIGMSGQFTSADVVKAWVAEEGDNVLFFIDLTGSGASGTGGPYSWTFHATAAGTEVLASATSPTPTPGGAATAAENDGGTIILTVPRSAFGAATSLTNLFVETRGGTPAPVQGQLAIIDRAPDSGAGADYVFATGGGSGPFYNPITTPEVDITTTFETPTTAIYVYNWTNTFPVVNSTHDANVTAGTVAYNITDEDGNIIEDFAFTATERDSNIIDPARLGNWTITVVYTGFNGTFALDLKEGPTTTPTTSSGPPTSSSPTDSSGPTDTGGTGDGDSSTSNAFLDKLKADPGYVILSTVCLVAVVAVGLVGRLVRWVL